MCGLVGVMGRNLNKAAVDAFNQLLWLDQLRGDHSTGVAAVRGPNQQDIVWLKDATTPEVLQQYKSYDQVVNSGAYVLLGHNRYATLGAKTKVNAHPFYFNDIIGAHNGTLPYGAQSKLKNHNEFGTDSEAFYFNLSEAQGDPRKVVPTIWGAWSFTWWDRRTKTMNFLRNKERPMYIAIAGQGKFLFWASERSMLMFVLSRYRDFHDFETFELDADNWYGYSLPLTHADRFEGYDFMIPVEGGKEPVGRFTGNYDAGAYGGGLGLGGSDVDVPFPTAKTETPKEPPKTGQQVSPSKPDTTTGSGKDLVVSDNTVILSEHRKRQQAKQAQLADEALLRRQERMSVGPIHRQYRGYKGVCLTQEQFDEATRDGCMWDGEGCRHDVTWAGVITGRTPIRWYGPDQFLCTNCKDDPAVQDYLTGTTDGEPIVATGTNTKQ